jgi:uncharacterized membrane protein
VQRRRTHRAFNNEPFNLAEGALGLVHADESPFSFPDTSSPTLLEFVYFSFAVGTTFATSDVEVRSSRLRGIVLCHGLLAFVYNTAIISMVVGLLTGK